MRDADRWVRVDTVFSEALARSGAVRSAYLDAACGDDADLRREVDSLLGAHEQAGTFLESVGEEEGGEDESTPADPLTPGSRLGAFEIVAKIGAGGMGAVYHAIDTRLERDVALKVLTRRALLADETLERLQLEARAVSRLKHPNVCTLHDIASARLDDREIRFLVMELVTGETLAGMLDREPLSVERAITYAIEIADALASAHQAGIVHRDLKPQNVMIAGGAVKLLDFGLASFMSSAARPPSRVPSTSPGTIVGTAAYMAPEQIAGQDVDARADVFSLGLLLYEMLTATRAFDRPTISETLQAILNDSPAPLPQSVPGDVRAIVGRCLEKDRARRFQTAQELADALRNRVARRNRHGALHRRRAWVVRIAIAGGVSLVAVFGFLWRGLDTPHPRVTEYVQITNDEQQKTGGLVTDGSFLYISELVKNRPVLVKASIGGGPSTEIPLPFSNPGLDDISPDGSDLVVGSYEGPGPYPYWLVPTRGGPARRIGAVRSNDVHPSPDGKHIAYAARSDVYVSGSNGDNPRTLATMANRGIGNIVWSPDGRRLRFAVFGPYEYSLWEIRIDGAGLRAILPGWNTPAAECCGRWTADGAYFVFQSRQNGINSLWAIREGRQWWRGTSSGPIRLTSGPVHFRSPAPSPDGQTIFAIGDQVRAEIMRRDKTTGEWVPFTLGATQRSITGVTYSPRGDWVTYVGYPDGTLWRSRPDDTERLQLTPPMEVLEPEWSPDSTRIAFQGRVPGGPWKLYVISRDGGRPEQLLAGPGSETAPTWSPDGQQIVFGSASPFDPGAKPSALYSLKLATKQVTKVPDSEGLWASQWAPDGRYLLGLSSDFGKIMLLDVRAGTWDELAKGSSLHFANWSSDSQYVYYEQWGADTGAMRIRIADRQEEKLGSIKALRRTTGPERCWSGLTPDNEFLVLRDIGSQEVYALSWTSK